MTYKGCFVREWLPDRGSVHQEIYWVVQKWKGIHIYEEKRTAVGMDLCISGRRAPDKSTLRQNSAKGSSRRANFSALCALKTSAFRAVM